MYSIVLFTFKFVICIPDDTYWPTKKMVFGHDLVEISDISTGNIIVKGVANHASKEYEFSHLLSYSDLVQSQLPFERGGKTIVPTPFTYANVSISVSYSESEVEDPVESVYEIKDEVHNDPDPIQSLLPILGLNGIKMLLRKLGMLYQNPVIIM